MRKMVFRFLTLGVILVAMAAVLPAAPIDCNSPTLVMVSDLMALGATGCQSQDKIFNNFNWTPASGGVPATNIKTNLVIDTGGSSDIHGWLFTPNDTSWVFGFTLTYDISVAPGYPVVGIVASKDQINSGAVPNGIVLTDTQTPGVMTMTGTFGGETQFLTGYNLQTVHTSSVAVIPEGKNLLSYEQDWVEGSTVPEPMSFVLIGTGLLGLGLLRRRVRG